MKKAMLLNIIVHQQFIKTENTFNQKTIKNMRIVIRSSFRSSKDEAKTKANLTPLQELRRKQWAGEFLTFFEKERIKKDDEERRKKNSKK